MTLRPSASLSLLVMSRAAKSEGPPAGDGTSSRIGRLDGSCAVAGKQRTAQAPKQSRLADKPCATDLMTASQLHNVAGSTPRRPGAIQSLALSDAGTEI